MTQELLEELLLTWENAQGSESPLTPEEVCRDCPHLLSELKRRIEALAELSPFLGSRQIAGRARDAKVEVRQQHRSEAGRSAIETADRDPSTHSRFVNLRAHARGGLGEVFRARDTSLNRDVALKVIRAPHDRDPLRRRRFLREAAITGMLEHPGIVPVHGVGTDDAGRPCYTMRFIEGRTLQSAIDQHFSGSMTADESIRNRRKLLQRFITVCNTVAYAHSRGVIHRDLKPANILLGSFDDTLVVDWGLAKRVDVDEQSSKSPAESKLAPASPQVEQWDVDTSIDDIPATILDDASATSSTAEQVTNDYVPLSSVDVPLTGALRVLGTPGYMSPEQTRDSSHLTYASDVFSLGAILYAMLTGRPPYASKSIAAILDDAKHARFPAPSTLDSRVPRALDAICLKAMCVRPEDRYASALELADDVERWLSDEPVSVSRESLSERVLRTARKHKSWTQAAAIFLSLLTIVSVIFAFLMWGQIQETQREKTNALQLAAEKSKLAEAERELRTLAEKLADEKDKLAESERKSRKLADDESRAALKTLSSVVTSLQKKLVDIPGTDVVRRELLTSAVDGLKKVADSLAVRDDADFYTCNAHREIALILLRVGDSVEGNGSEQALAHLAKASEISERLRYIFPDDLAVQRQLSLICESLGDIYMQIGQWDPAMDAYQRSLNVSIANAKLDPNSEHADRDLAFGYEKVGDVYLKKNQLAEARAAVEESKKYLDKASQKYPSSNLLKKDRVVNLSKLGSLLSQEGDFVKAAETFSSGIALIDELLAAKVSLPQNYRMIMCNKLGEVFETTEQWSEAEAAFGEGLSDARRISEADPTNPVATRDLGIALHHQGDVARKQKRIDEAEAFYQEALKLRRTLAESDRLHALNQVDLARTCYFLGEVAVMREQDEAARKYFNEALTILKPFEERGVLVSTEDRLLWEMVQESTN